MSTFSPSVSECITHPLIYPPEADVRTERELCTDQEDDQISARSGSRLQHGIEGDKETTSPQVRETVILGNLETIVFSAINGLMFVLYTVVSERSL